MSGVTFRPGTVLTGRFTLEDLLEDSDGAGFWRATDRVLARSVAVHLLPETDRRAQPLLSAARRSALVSDSHLLRVLDADSSDGAVFVVHEWGSGVSLDRLLLESSLSPRQAAWLVKEVAEAISTAHRADVAHGRLLPENVLISESGSVKLIGFAVDAVLRSVGAAGPRQVTNGVPVSPRRSDVVNLAALLYATLVGRWPGTEGTTVPSAPVEHGRPMRPRQVRAGVPRPLDAICERVLNADSHPHMHPIGSAHEIYAALSDYIGDPGGAPVPLQPGDMDSRRSPSWPDLAETGEMAVPAVGTLGSSSGSPGSRRPLLTDPARTGAVLADLEATAPAPTDLVATDLEATDPAPSDLEATQAGAPLFSESSDAEWVPSTDDRAPEVGVEHASGGPDLLTDAPAAPAEPRADAQPSAAAEARAAEPRATAVDGLFSDEPRRPARSAPAGARSTGPGNGSAPRHWGPDGDQPPPGDPFWIPGPVRGGADDELPGRSWLILAVSLAIVLVVVVGTLVALSLTRGPADRDAATPTPSASVTSRSAPASGPVTVAAITDFDPEGDPPEENPELARLAVDGKPGTAWQTMTYRGNPRLGGLKSGVGLRLDLGKASRVGEVDLSLLGSPTALQVLAAPRGVAAAPTNIDGLTKVATDDAAGTRVRLRLAKPVTTRWLVVWLTSLPAAPGGYRGQVAEVSVRS